VAARQEGAEAEALDHTPTPVHALHLALKQHVLHLGLVVVVVVVEVGRVVSGSGGSRVRGV